MHEIEYTNYSVNADKAAIEEERNRVCEYNSDSRCGLHYPIRWNDDRIFDSYAEAQSYIESIDEPYLQIAVKYREFPDLKKSKKYEDIKARLDEATKKYNVLRNAIHYKNIKSSFISCKNCGSKISARFMKTNLCPVCYSDMRPESTLDHIKRLKDKVQELEKALDSEVEKLKAKQIKNSEVRWLVKVEWHC